MKTQKKNTYNKSYCPCQSKGLSHLGAAAPFFVSTGLFHQTPAAPEETLREISKCKLFSYGHFVKKILVL